MAIQEHHMKGTGVINLKSNNDTYELFCTSTKNNKHHGVGILTRKDFKAEYKVISDRICKATIKLENENRNLVFISAYAPTLEVSEKNKNIRDRFYQDLNNSVNEVNNRDLFIIGET